MKTEQKPHTQELTRRQVRKGRIERMQAMSLTRKKFDERMEKRIASRLKSESELK